MSVLGEAAVGDDVVMVTERECDTGNNRSNTGEEEETVKNIDF